MNNNSNNNNEDLTYQTGLKQNTDTGLVNYEDIKQSNQTADHDEPHRMSIQPKQHAPVKVNREDPEQIKESTLSDNKQSNSQKKPLNTGGDEHHVAEQPSHGLGGLTGKQPVGEINFKKL